MDNDTIKIWLKEGGRAMNISPEENRYLREYYARVTNNILYGEFHEYLREYHANEKKPKKIIFHDPATIVFWRDGSKTVVKCQKGDTYDREKGLLLCYVKKWVANNKSRYLNDILKYSEVDNEI